MITLKQLLVATDFGPAAESALQYGRALTRSVGGELHVVHVVDNLFVRAIDGFECSAIFLEDQQALERSEQARTDALLDDEDRRDLHAVAATATSTSPAEAIVEYARSHAIDLIIVGTHGRGAVGHLFLGSVAERVVRTAPCPVLTVHHPEREFVRPDALVAVTRP